MGRPGYIRGDAEEEMAVEYLGVATDGNVMAMEIFRPFGRDLVSLVEETAVVA